MKKTKKRKKIEKGEFGYFKSEKKRRLILTAILLGVPLFIFATMWAYHGTRNTIWTVTVSYTHLDVYKRQVLNHRESPSLAARRAVSGFVSRKTSRKQIPAKNSFFFKPLLPFSFSIWGSGHDHSSIKEVRKLWQY